MNLSPQVPNPIPQFYTVETIDNFLPAEVHKKLHELLMPQPLPDIQHSTETKIMKLRDKAKRVPWFYIPNPGRKNSGRKNLFYLTHMVYEENIVSSPLYNEIMPHIRHRLDIKALIRLKINMYPCTETLYEHGMHVDTEYPHKAAILSINTCDGYTKLEDGTKVDSIENRILLFDASKPHTPSTTTDQPVRINININYF